MELLVNKKKEVFTFDGSLGEKVWEPEPITRFRFKKPVDNDWIKEQLAANHPTAGIVFNGVPYIGTSDGVICTPKKKMQRIPEILVDPELFLDEYRFLNNTEKETFMIYQKEGLKSLDFKKGDLVERIFKIDRLLGDIDLQNRIIDKYLMGRLSIRGFVVNKRDSQAEEILYDGHLLGITETDTGKIINELAPQSLYQITPSDAGFVPVGCPPVAKTKTIIKGGIEKQIGVSCVDYRSLWDLTGQGKWVSDICPRDGSGYAAAKFATDIKTIAISHGDHPCYRLDILKIKDGIQEKIRSIGLDPSRLPSKLLVMNQSVFGDYGNTIRNFSTENIKDIFTPDEGGISSIADSGLCTVRYNDETLVYDIFSSKKLDSFKGEYTFLPKAPQ